MPRAIAYARYSSYRQREESITAQLRAIREYARRERIEIVREFTDEAKSATTDRRPNFQAMMTAIAEGLDVDLVLVHKSDRFARNRNDARMYKRFLEEHGARVVAVAHPTDDSPEGMLMEGITESLDEYYSRNLAREVMKGMRENAYQALFNGGWVAFGYRVADRRYEIDEDEAPAVRMIFSMFLEGQGYGAITAALRARNFRTRQGRPFGKNSIYEILRNPIYCGRYVFNRAPRRIGGKRNWHRRKDPKEIIVIEDAVPAIVPADEWEAVQRKMDGRRKQPRRRDGIVYILTGKVRCGLCNAAMVGNSQRRKAGGEPYRYYACSRRLRTKECEMAPRRKEELEAFVLDAIEQEFFRPERIPLVAKKVMEYHRQSTAGHDEERRRIKADLADMDRRLANLVRAIEEGGVDYGVLAARINELKAARADAERKLEDLSSPLDMLTEEMVVQYLRAQGRSGSIDRSDSLEAKKFVDLYVHEIIVPREGLPRVVFTLALGADSDGVGGPTVLYPHA